MSRDEPEALPARTDARGWGMLGDRLRLRGDGPGADHAYACQIRAGLGEAGLGDPELIAAADALCDGEPAAAHRLLSAILARRPNEPSALAMFADLAQRSGRHDDAERLLARCLAQSPDFTAARCAYAIALHQQGRTLETLAQTDILLGADRGHPVYRHIRAAALMRVGEYAEAAEAYRQVLDAHPDLALTWMAYGHALKTLGRQAEAIAAYRESVRLRPALGEAWWSLANLKTVALTAGDIAVMRASLGDPAADAEDRFHLQFALGKAHEDARDFAHAFACYEQGNALRRAELDYDADETTGQVARSKALLSASFFESRAGQGSPRPDPIFIVGLPRSGSTLIEQILASHSQVEGTQELPDIEGLADRLAGHPRRSSEGAYPDVLAALPPGELAALGEEYLRRAAVYRKTGAPLFIDKTPNNFAHIGLIQLILPNAKIVDARRHPVGCCFSAFKQHFAIGQAFTYSVTDLAHYYRDYVELMAHFDAVLPGRIHRVIYEELVVDPEAEVRRLLAYCGLPFEAACLRFYENPRAVRTASSEQVRQPIFTDATDHWRNFQPWLGALIEGLGEVADAYPEVPQP